MNNIVSRVYQKEGDSVIYLQIGDQWYSYDSLSKPLGRGSMGTVYLGYNCDTHERIAVKRVRDIYANNKQIRERAKQEASLAFVHPNLVRMIGLCEYNCNTGPIFILSEFIEGVTLDVHVKEQLNQLPDTERLEKICFECCCVLDALQYMHERGVVHRDVKPANIMLEKGSTVKLMDLGIARMNGGNKYSTCGFIGTPQYAAPEQILRDMVHTEITGQTDIYALAVSMYELITGINPFCSDVDTEMLSRQVTMKLPYHKAIPRGLYKVLLKATEKKPYKRYNSALEFKNAIINAMEEYKKCSIMVVVMHYPVIVSACVVLFILLFLLFLIL